MISSNAGCARFLGCLSEDGKPLRRAPKGDHTLSRERNRLREKLGKTSLTNLEKVSRTGERCEQSEA